LRTDVVKVSNVVSFLGVGGTVGSSISSVAFMTASTFAMMSVTCFFAGSAAAS
jgi:hypothetical protein